MTNSATTIPANDLTESADYSPIKPYWFYSKTAQDQTTWFPFSLLDAQKLEQGFTDNQEIVPTNGNRYDVNLNDHTRRSVYWIDAPNDVRRSKWLYSTSKTPRFIPIDPSLDDILENLFIETCNKKLWHLKHELEDGSGTVVFHGPNQMHCDLKTPVAEHRILKRGLPELFLPEIPSDEKDPVEHVCFVVHGVGAACDIKFRSLIECVEDFRQTSRIILENHFKSYIDNDQIHRIEFIPIYWHGDLHLESEGVDNHLTPLTLPSVFKLRTFINTTLADILFYTSPIYCQRIVTRCTNEMNRLYELFLQRNPSYKGEISVIGHSLGSVILYDILSNQTDEIPTTEKAHSLVEYGRLKFPLAYFFALGSPIGMFLTVRGVTSIAADFTLPTCRGLLNIFHPYDPIAYRIEPLIDPQWKASPVLLSHHKGRKRIHLEIADRFSKASDVKRRMVDAWKNTMTSVTSLVDSYRTTASETPTTDSEHENDDEDTQISEWNNRPIGKLNQGRRIDYVLQHGPIEAINEYMFAFTSHVSYWTSEDTMLLILKEILQLSGFEPETRFETIEQMVKSNVLYCFTKESPTKSEQFRPYLSSTIK